MTAHEAGTSLVRIEYVMSKAVLTSKDFWSGLLFMGMGAAALIFGSDLRVGTAARMGPGFVRTRSAGS